MVIAISADTVRATAQRHPTGAMVTDFIGRRGVTGGGPSSYLVEVPPGYEIRPHFHGVNQYQVVVRGSATLGRQPMSRGDFHYADAYSAYGPILATDEGMSFFTLRQVAYDGFHQMPGSRHLMQPSPRRTFVCRVEPDAARTDAVVELAALDDGTSAYALTAVAHKPVTLPAVEHGGAFVLVIAGALRTPAVELPELSCVWIGPLDPLPQLAAADNGAVAIFLSYARTTDNGESQ